MPVPSLSNDDELLLQVADSNEAAFTRLFENYHQQLGLFIFRLTDSMEMAEEVVQDVFLKIWTNHHELAGIRNFKAYLFVAAKNHALNCIKKAVRQQKHQLVWEVETIGEEQLLIPDADDNKYYSLLDTAIDRLPPQQQKVYLLSRHERLKYAEIAEEMNLSRETVKKYLQHAVTFISNYCEAHSDMVVFLLLFFKFF
ncbi:RNA polymerase sigma-70 factor [Mucilaginibacter mali]|uniref:RNA polymerase sigma-70 factor n=1 Tax=Mucilaginibacter mali TaxID=2740462 RepID=A0A7D4UFD0_9SPHI|nr:RNA polymerase sigma-70 factor [Mucilaginibacter mali]QKJ30256.1 RNA polymerase sigma-70 factor [Mucilaginibacter mali]